MNAGHAWACETRERWHWFTRWAMRRTARWWGEAFKGLLNYAVTEGVIKPAQSMRLSDMVDELCRFNETKRSNE